MSENAKSRKTRSAAKTAKTGGRKPGPQKTPRPSAKARAAAQKAKERAKGAGAAGPNGPDAQRALRDGAIVAALAAGDSEAEVAKEFGIAQRTVREVRKKRASMPSLFDVEPVEVLEELVRDNRQRQIAFDRFAHKHADTNPAVAVAAMKGGLATTERRTELLVAVGVLPRNLELFRAESVLRKIAEEMAETMVRVRRGEITIEQADEHFVELANGADTDHQQRRKALAA